MTTAFWASLGLALLGDFGAEVIRVEKLSDTRERRLDGRDQPPGQTWNCDLELANRNKLSLAVNLDLPQGRQVLERLVLKADVCITDTPFALLHEQGLDYETLTRLKPDLVYARASGFGPKGPDRDLPALDELAATRTGMMPILPQPGQPPVYTGAGQMYTTVMLAFAVMAALWHREQTGEGQEVDVSLFGGNMYAASLDIQAYLAIQGERFLHSVSRLDAGNPMSGTLYPTEDGRWVTLTMPDTDRWWPALAEVVGLDPADPRFDSHEKRCEVNRLELIQLLDEAFQRRPADYWRAMFTERQMSADVIEDYSFPAEDEQVRRNRYILELDHPSVGPIKMLGFPIFMSDSPARLHRTAPWLGQHSADILGERLGYSEDEIVQLQAAGVVA
jgi:crotonobetainyl-CoA:carnitine CoA-transferase CaiB-like acyl-CoA transferase